MDKYENVRVIFADVEITMKKRSKRSKDSTLWYSLLESIVTKIKPSLFLQKQRGRKNPPLEKKKTRNRHEKHGAEKYRKEKRFPRENRKTIEIRTSVGKRFPSSPPFHRITHYGTLYTGNAVTRNLITRQRRNDTDAKTLLEVALRIDWFFFFFSRYVTMDEKFSKISLTRVGGGGNFVFNFDPELFFFFFLSFAPPFFFSCVRYY